MGASVAIVCHTSATRAAAHAATPATETAVPERERSRRAFATLTAAKITRNPALPSVAIEDRSKALATTSVSAAVMSMPRTGWPHTVFSSDDGSSPSSAIDRLRRAVP